MNGPESATRIDLTYQRVACSQHAEPFRADWPVGFPEFALQLFDEVTPMIAVETPGTPDAAATIEAALDEIPLCERVSRTTLIRVYIASGIGSDDVCQICNQPEIGVQYSTRSANGEIKHWKHIGFRCITELERAN